MQEADDAFRERSRSGRLRPRRFRPERSRRITLWALRPGNLALAGQLLPPLFRVVCARKRREKGDDIVYLSLGQGERLDVLVEIRILQTVALVVVVLTSQSVSCEPS